MHDLVETLSGTWVIGRLQLLAVILFTAFTVLFLVRKNRRLEVLLRSRPAIQVLFRVDIFTSESDGTIAGYLQKEMSLPFLPTIGADIETVELRKPRKVASVSVNIDGPTPCAYVHLGAQHLSEAELGPLAFKYEQLGWTMSSSLQIACHVHTEKQRLHQEAERQRAEEERLAQKAFNEELDKVERAMALQKKAEQEETE